MLDLNRFAGIVKVVKGSKRVQDGGKPKGNQIKKRKRREGQEEKEKGRCSAVWRQSNNLISMLLPSLFRASLFIRA